MTIFGYFYQKEILVNPALSYTSSYGFLAPCQNLQKTNDRITRKCLDRKMDERIRQKAGQTLFHRTLATARRPKIPQCEWLILFWPISTEQHFSQTEDLYRNTANDINFHYRTNSSKIKDQFFL